MKEVLVIGAAGQVGSELTMVLRHRYGCDHVVAGWHVTPLSHELRVSGPYEMVDCLNEHLLARVIKEHKIQTVYHLAAILSAAAEDDPRKAWDVNIRGVLNVLEVAREFQCSVFIPSSIGAFGPTTPKDRTPQNTVQRPDTIYGVSKVSGELLGDFYFRKYRVDVRGLRYPGLVSTVTLPGGGTTNYAVEIFYKALLEGKFTCYLRPDTYLDMMYMPDAIRAAIELMKSNPEKLKHRNSYNVTAMSFCPEEVAAEIRRFLPDFVMDYDVNPVKQSIADSWPNSIDDSVAREEWGWSPRFDLQSMTKDMLEVLSKRFGLWEKIFSHRNFDKYE
ncbi:MAG: NAD-dependent epimerase/dehydratase family protein [Candidatus Aminicenantales bacterium]